MFADIGIICGLIAISVSVLGLCDVFRLRSIVGPQRLMDGESILTLFAILLLSSCMALLSAAALARVVHLNSDQSLDVVNGLIYVILLLVALLLTSRMRPRGLRQLGVTARQFFRAIPRALLTAIAILPLVYAASILVQLVIEALHRAMPEAHPMLQQLGADQHSIWFAVVIVEAVILVPLAEELLFRGLLQTILVYLLAGRRQPSTAPRWIGVLITAAIFAAVHREVAFFLPLFVLAVGLGYLYERTGNLWACAMMHGLFNGLQIVLYLGVVTK